MNWEAFGAIAEFVGAISVLATLLYLALQVREARRLLQSNSHQARTDRNIQVLQTRFGDPVMQRVAQKLESGNSLDREDLYHGTGHFLIMMRHLEDSHYQRELGLVEEGTWQASLAGIRLAFTPPWADQAWARFSMTFRPSFVELVEDVREGNA